MKLTPKTAIELAQYVLPMLDETVNKPKQFWWGELTYKQLLSKLKPFVTQFSNEDLLLFSAYYKVTKEDYDIALPTLTRRSGMGIDVIPEFIDID